MKVAKFNFPNPSNDAQQQAKLFGSSRTKSKTKCKVISRKIKWDCITFSETSEKESIPNANKTNLEHLQRIRAIVESENNVVGERTKITEGFVYLLENPAWKNWFKVGMAVDFESRLNTYNQYDPTSKYEYLEVRYSSNRSVEETILLEEFSKNCSSQKGEWFKVANKDVALKLFKM